MRHCLSLILVLSFTSGLLAQEGALQLLPSASELSACSGETLQVSVKLDNPVRKNIGGYQVFLRFPARYFEVVRYEPAALSAFVATAGPAPLGNGYRSCSTGTSDGWSDLAGEDVVSVVATFFGEGSSQAFQGESATLGSFVFRPRGEVTESQGVLFSPNQEVCHAHLDEVTRVFDAQGKPLSFVAPSTFRVSVKVAGPAPRNLSCVDAGDKVNLAWSPPLSGQYTGYRIYRNSEVLISLPIPGITSYADADPPQGTILYEVALLLQGGLEGCRDSCSVERSAGALFVRGDANRDGEIDLGDAVAILNHLFRGSPMSCEDAGDFDDSGVLDLTDSVGVLNYLFKPGEKPAPSPPFPGEGNDPTADELTCKA